ncbi:hypothetical protein [Bartonella birtlesii]|nr:hypothetical protein [Bartonella birtlesii]
MSSFMCLADLNVVLAALMGTMWFFSSYGFDAFIVFLGSYGLAL